VRIARHGVTPDRVLRFESLTRRKDVPGRAFSFWAAPGDCRTMFTNAARAGRAFSLSPHRPRDPHLVSQPPSIHRPVLWREALDQLDPQPGQFLVDGTLGGGGHTRLLAERVGPAGLILGVDRDPAAVEAAESHLRGLPVMVATGNYCDLPEILDQARHDWRESGGVDGILLDLGLSSDQLADETRGFSFHSHGPLDLRFDPTRGEPAWRLLERLSQEDLANVIYRYGEERLSRRFARALVEARRRGPLKTAEQVAAVLRRAAPRDYERGRIDPATRTFQALRIAVNQELDSLELALRRLPDCLRPGGRLLVISFHSLEDRLVKHAFRDDPRLSVLTRKPILPNQAEAQANPRSRSARLRVAERQKTS